MERSCLFCHLPEEIGVFVLKEPPHILINSDKCPKQTARPCIHARLEEGVESISFGGRTLLSCEKGKSCNCLDSNSCCLGLNKECANNCQCPNNEIREI